MLQPGSPEELRRFDELQRRLKPQFRDEVADEYHRSLELLRTRGGGIPTLNEVVHHHRVTEGDGFETASGYESFQPVSLDERLAEDMSGAIRAHRPGRILMPLYRPPCDDGFMLIEERSEWPVPRA